MAEDFRQFVAHNFDDLLARGERSHDVLAQRFVLDFVDQLFDDLEVDVGFKQRQPDLPQRLLDVVLVQDGLAAQGLKRALQLF